MHKIKYLTHREIDKAKWDKTISKSYNGLVYGYSFFLDSMANKQWDALILGDYEAVFPLVWRSKFGIKYLYQPYFCQQLGVFSPTKISTQLLDLFLEHIPSKFRYFNIHLNYENIIFKPNISFINRTTFQLNLNQAYINLYDNYSDDAKKNIAKATLKGFEYEKTKALETVTDVFFKAYGMHYPQQEVLKNTIMGCMQQAIALNKGFCRSIVSESGELWSAGFFFMSNGYIHYAIAAPTDAGKMVGATHLLIDEVIKEFSNQALIFDFEGSDIKSVAYFYSKFGSHKVHYLQIKANRLPFWCRFLKKG